jgi:hypothetical protein
MSKTVKGNGRPLNPFVGQLWYEPVSGTLRRWNGKLWAETSKRMQLSSSYKPEKRHGK